MDSKKSSGRERPSKDYLDAVRKKFPNYDLLSVTEKQRLLDLVESLAEERKRAERAVEAHRKVFMDRWKLGSRLQEERLENLKLRRENDSLKREIRNNFSFSSN